MAKLNFTCALIASRPSLKVLVHNELQAELIRLGCSTNYNSSLVPDRFVIHPTDRPVVAHTLLFPTFFVDGSLESRQQKKHKELGVTGDPGVMRPLSIAIARDSIAQQAASATAFVKGGGQQWEGKGEAAVAIQKVEVEAAGQAAGQAAEQAQKSSDSEFGNNGRGGGGTIHAQPDLGEPDTVLYIRRAEWKHGGLGHRPNTRWLSNEVEIMTMVCTSIAIANGGGGSGSENGHIASGGSGGISGMGHMGGGTSASASATRNGQRRPLRLQVFQPANDYHRDRAQLSRALAIVSPHGGQLANLIFAPPQTLIVELADIAISNLCFLGLARMLRFPYASVTAMPYGHDDHVLRANATTVVSALASHINALGDGLESRGMLLHPTRGSGGGGGGGSGASSGSGPGGSSEAVGDAAARDGLMARAVSVDGQALMHSPEYIRCSKEWREWDITRKWQQEEKKRARLWDTVGLSVAIAAALVAGVTLVAVGITHATARASVTNVKKEDEEAAATERPPAFVSCVRTCTRLLLRLSAVALVYSFAMSRLFLSHGQLDPEFGMPWGAPKLSGANAVPVRYFGGLALVLVLAAPVSVVAAARRNTLLR
jgi:hypothetical protein